MVGDDAVMDQVNLTGLIEVGMGISVYFLTTSSPTRVGDTAGRNPCLLHDFLDHLVYAASLFEAVLSVFN